MTRQQMIRYGLLFILLSFSISSEAAITGKVVSISDGDTITILDNERTQHKIRLWGIDCPEGGQDFGNKAKKFTSNLVSRKTVSVIPMDTDRYGRTVGIVKIDGKDGGEGGGKTLNEELVRAGMAWVFTKYCNKPQICDQWKQIEAGARKSKVGLWAHPNPVPPWEYRQRGQAQTQAAITTTATATQGGSPYHGNTKSMVFHEPGCRVYNCKNCTAVFTTREAAIAAGYRPCGMCRP